MKLISEGLQKSPGHDLRSQFQEPLFRRSITSLEDIRAGAVLTGDVFIFYLSKIKYLSSTVIDEKKNNLSF